MSLEKQISERFFVLRWFFFINDLVHLVHVLDRMIHIESEFNSVLDLYLVKFFVFGQTSHLKLSVMGESEFGWNLKASQPQPHQEFTLESTCCLNQYFKWCLESQAQYQTYPKGIHLTKSLL